MQESWLKKPVRWQENFDRLMQLYSEHIFLNDHMESGYLTWENGKILGISKTSSQDYLDYTDLYIFPGYIDNHIHGWACGSFWHEKTADSIYRMKDYLPKTGVTSFLATSGADKKNEIVRGVKEAYKVFKDQKTGAQMLGVHLEGPFINKKYKGMQKEECCIDPDLNLMEQLVALQGKHHMIRLMTLAPELKGAKELITFCKDHQIQCSIGHSDANFDLIKELKSYGLSGVTHMFSGMKGMHHRELGVAGSALYFDDLYCEFAKQTGMTVSHEAFDIVYRIKTADRILLTTDCVGYAHVKEPFHHYIRKETFIPDKKGLCILKEDGTKTFIDSMDYDQVKHLEMGYNESVVSLSKHSKVSPLDMIKMTSWNPAVYIGVSNQKGALYPGYDADIIVCKPDYELVHTFCLGVQYL